MVMPPATTRASPKAQHRRESGVSPDGMGVLTSWGGATCCGRRVCPCPQFTPSPSIGHAVRGVRRPRRHPAESAVERGAGGAGPNYAGRIGRWTEGPPLPAPHSGARVAQADDRLYVIGGSGRDDRPAPVDAFEPSNGRWLEAPQPVRRRTSCGVAMRDGTLYLLGGATPEGPAATVESCTVEQVFHVHTRLPPA